MNADFRDFENKELIKYLSADISENRRPDTSLFFYCQGTSLVNRKRTVHIVPPKPEAMAWFTVLLT